MGQVAKLKRTWNLASIFQIVQKIFWKLLSLLISISWPNLVISWVAVQKIYSKMHPVSFPNIYRDVTDLVNHGMFKNKKTRISWERNVILVRNKKNLNLCLRWHILRNYRFISEVTFKGKPTRRRGGRVKFPPPPQIMVKGNLRPKLHPCFYDIFFVDFMDKEPCSKFWSDLMKF